MIQKLMRLFRRSSAPAPTKPMVRYILRPRDGIQTGFLPEKDPAHIMFRKTRDDDGDLFVAVCSTCGGNCGQCGTSIGAGVPIDFEYLSSKIR
jgi:hypothetical protein